MQKITDGDCIRQGHLAGRHYYVFVVQNGIEHNAKIQDVLQYVMAEIMPRVADGYEYESLTWSNRYGGWLVQVQKPMPLKDF